MIRHVVMFSWKPEATEDQKRRATAEVASLPSIVPGIRAFTAGADIGVNHGNFDFAVCADFDDADAYRSYRDNPAHRAVVAKYIAPILATRAAVQLEF